MKFSSAIKCIVPRCSASPFALLQDAVRSVLSLTVLAGIALAATGCGSTSTTLPKEWEASVGEEARTINVDPKREHLLVGKEKETTIINASGNIVPEPEDKGMFARFKEEATDVDVKSNVTIAGMSLSEMEANKLDYVMLTEPGIALAFDYTASDDVIRALNLETGEKMWEQADYQWSLEKYQAVGAQIVEGVVKNVGLRAGSAVGAASAGANSTLLRERYVSNLVAKVPDRNSILLKTVEDLRLVNLDTGTTEWTIDGVAGSSLMHVEWLPSGDVVLATDYTDLLGRVSGGKKVLRINPENGTVKWRADHDADAVQNAFLKNGFLLLRHGDGDIEAFQTTDGTKAYEIGMDWTAKLSSGLGGVNYQGEQYNYQRSGEPVLHGNSVYIPDLADTDVVGAPDYNIQQVDLATGTNQWTTEPVKKANYLWDLTAVDDQLLGRAVLAGPENSLFGQEGRQKVVSWSLSDGTLQWKHEGPYYASSKTVVTSAMGLASPSHLNLVTQNGKAYTATDTSLAAYGIDDGAVEASASAQATGSQVWLAKHNQTLVDLRDESVSFHSMSDLSPTRKPISFESELEFYAQEDNYLMVATEDVLHVINLRKQTLKGTIAPDEELGRLFVSGNLRSGVFVTEGAESIFVLTKDYIVKKYAIQ